MRQQPYYIWVGWKKPSICEQVASIPVGDKVPATPQVSQLAPSKPLLSSPFTIIIYVIIVIFAFWSIIIILTKLKLTKPRFRWFSAGYDWIIDLNNNFFLKIMGTCSLYNVRSIIIIIVTIITIIMPHIDKQCVIVWPKKCIPEVLLVKLKDDTRLLFALLSPVDRLPGTCTIVHTIDHHSTS